MARKLLEEYKKWGLIVNMDKSNYMAIEDQTQDLLLEEELGIFKHCENYKYLGVIITKDGKQDHEIKRRITLGKSAISALNSILWDKKITKENKSLIFKAIVRSIATYGSETWQLKYQTISKLLTMEMDFWRRSALISRRDKIRNNVIKSKMGVKNSILDYVQHKQLQWYGHVKRMSEERIPKKVMEWLPPERLKRGRPTTTWIQGIITTMRERRLEEGQWVNREDWRESLKLVFKN